MMKYCYGVVEDRADPLKIGRVRVRVRGYHTADKQFISTPDLAWSHVIMPVTTSGLTPFGSNHSLVEGTDVFGFFRDEEMQEFVVLGVQQGITQDGYKEDESGGLVARAVDTGFGDPRRQKKSDYEGTADGLNPPHSPQRPNELAVSLAEAPHLPKGHIFDYTGRGLGKTLEFEDSEKTLPYYPLKTNTSDVNQFSALDKQAPKKRKSHDGAPLHRDLSLVFDTPPGINDYSIIEGVKSLANPQYPYNHATYTESGHLFELDDTRGFERVSLQHRSGTYFEWQPNGDAHNRVVKDNYTVICGDDEVFIAGKVNIKVLGDAKISVEGKTGLSSKGQLTVTAPNISLYGNELKLNS